MQINGRSIAPALRNVLIGVAILVAMTPLIGQIRAATLEDYQKRLNIGGESLRELRMLGEGTGGPSTNSDETLMASIRRAIPSTEKIEWSGGSIETDNNWLAIELDAYAAETSPSKQTAILDHLDQRLMAVRQKVAELQNATAATQSKDEDKRKLAEILRREEYQTQQPEGESLFQKWSRQILEWLGKMFPRLNIPQQQPSGLSSLSMVLQILLYVALALGIGYLVYRLLPLFSGRFGTRKKTSKSERVILGEWIGDDQSSEDLFAEAELLARNGELRLAIRKGYIALLCELNDRKVIGLARHKTNRDYLRDLSARRDLFKNVRGLTTSFERHWYGSDESSESDWVEFRDLYSSTIHGV